MKCNLIEYAAATLILGSLALWLPNTARGQPSGSFVQLLTCTPTDGTNYSDTLEVFMDSSPPDTFTGRQFSFFSAPMWVGGTVDPRHLIAIGIAPDEVQMWFELTAAGAPHPLAFDYVLWDGGPIKGTLVESYRVFVDGTGGFTEVELSPDDINFGSTPMGRALLVKASNQARDYGHANAPLSVSYTGFASGDTSASLTGTLSFRFEDANQNPVANVDAGTPPGVYSIIPGGLTSTNYLIIFAPGTLTIAPPPWQLRAAGFDAAGQVLLHVSKATLGTTFVIERSPDLVNWGPIRSGPVTTGDFVVADVPPAGHSAAFYRLRMQ